VVVVRKLGKWYAGSGVDAIAIVWLFFNAVDTEDAEDTEYAENGAGE
jgi:hypothetical protein